MRSRIWVRKHWMKQKAAGWGVGTGGSIVFRGGEREGGDGEVEDQRKAGGGGVPRLPSYPCGRE